MGLRGRMLLDKRLISELDATCRPEGGGADVTERLLHAGAGHMLMPSALTAACGHCCPTFLQGRLGSGRT